MPTEGLTSSPLLDFGFLFARVMVGLFMAAHGAQKLFGWFGGYGIKGTGAFFGQLGFQPGTFFATAAGLAELVSGLLVAVGLLGPIGPAIMLADMVVAMLSVHITNGFFATKNGIELPFLYSIAAVRFALTGPGRYSLDEAFGFQWALSSRVVWVALAVGVLGGIGNLMLRKPPAPAAPKA